jgi:diguanylate cyclase (GGDEF)-like protein/PAS domain S-box-containing protein
MGCQSPPRSLEGLRKAMTNISVQRLLLIEDNQGDARLLREMFESRGSHSTEITHVATMSAAEAHFAAHLVDIILLDLNLPDAQGLEALQRAHGAAPRVPLVVLTGLDDQSLGVQALQRGAQDYLVKGEIDARGLLRAVRYAIERARLEDALFVEKELAQVTLNSIGDAVICTGISGHITFLNLVAEKMAGWSRQDATARPLTDVFRIVDATTRESGPNPMQLAVGQDRTEHLSPNCLLIRCDGFEIPIEGAVSPIHDREGRATGAVIVFRDVSTARLMAQQMTHSAQHDFLTGLPNRMLLNDRIGQAIALAPRHAKQVAVLFLDLDGFKHINDSLGHPVGDKLLQSVAGRLVKCVRTSDTVSRQGGDEFVVLVSEAEHWEDAAIVARRMLQAVMDVHPIDEHDLHVTASIGVSVYPDDGMDAETLIKNADTAMYQAKENGRQSYQFFKRSMHVRAVERQSIEASLRRALEHHEFVLHYQPKINLRTGLISGAEALIRWTHPTRGDVSPAQFIPIAEDCGLILPIGRWVLREACQQARAWADAGLFMPSMAVNVSAMEMRDEGFLKELFAILAETRLDPRSLELELTEGVLMKHAELTANILQTLRESGVQVAVDDFGTGYSSLSYLRKFPIDELKIDQSFVSQITCGGDDAAIVTAVISMARSLKLRVVAEGVETQAQLDFLRRRDCDEAQGYYFSRPVPPRRFEGLLRSGIPQASSIAHAPPRDSQRAQAMVEQRRTNDSQDDSSRLAVLSCERKS